MIIFNRALKIIVGVLAAYFILILVLWIILISINWNQHKSSIIKTFEKWTDFNVTNLDKIDVNLSSSPRIMIEGLQLQSAGNTSPLSSFSAEHLLIKVSIPPFITNGEIFIDEFVLSDGRIVFHKTEKVERKKPKRKHSWEQLPSFFINSMLIQNTIVTYLDSIKNKEINSEIKTMRVESTAENQPLILDGQGSIEGLPFKVHGSFGSLDQFIKSDHPYPLHLNGTLADQQFAMNGQLNLEGRERSINIDFNASGEDLSDILKELGIDVGKVPSYKIQASVYANPSKVALNNLQFTLGDSYFYGDSSLLYKKSRPYFQLTLRSPLLHVKDFQGLIDAKNETPSQQAKSNDEQVRPIFSRDPLSLPWMKEYEGQWQITIGRIDDNSIQGLVRNLEIAGSLEEGILEVNPFKGVLAGGNFAGDAKIEADHAPIKGIINFAISQIKISRAIAPFIGNLKFADLKPQEFLTGAASSNVKLKSFGNSLHELASNLDGHLNFAIEDGQVSAAIIEGLGLDVTEAAASLLADNPTTPLLCAVGDFVIENGLIETKVLLISTKDSNLIGKGQLNLANETIQLQIEAHAKDFSIGTSQSPIQIKGPLRKIQVDLVNRELIARLGLAVMGAIINPALGILPFIEPGLTKEGKCYQYFDELRQIQQKAKKEVSP